MAKGDDGLTAWEAIQLLFPEPEPLKSDLELWSGGTTWVDTVWWWTNAVSSFQDLLRKGSWYGKGCRVPVDPTPRHERLHPDLWDILEIHLDSNTASSRVFEYEGLRFFAADAPAVSFKTKVETQRAYDEHVKSERKQTGHAPTARADEAWGKVHGLSREKMRELRDNSPARTDEDRRKGARKRKLAD